MGGGGGVCVQVGGNNARSVGVGVPVGTSTGNVGGGKGFSPLCGFMKIIKKTPPTQRMVKSTSPVRIFQSMAVWFV